MFELALRLKVKLQSHDLLRALVSVLKSLREKFDVGYRALVKAMEMAWAFSEVAVRAGNQDARQWRHDRNYVRFLSRELVFA